ncbi:response regulator [Plastoroseomonas hellenica]|uniref:Response regulator n=1 Tax=Plastoroseomonas hellenica TaxID=2687306 RepID=A0ABS5FA59_9PROT|nr:response regulator [Plastoroseomonas hellenica]MBR0647860.1 response regulator [Plastoroseomonas hellenica]MBR0669447.1 response regulator [Plastoroseomonas hellenica]
MVIPSDASILVVEDEWIIAEAISRSLRRWGYRVLGPAADVPAALALLEQETPAAALLDASLGHQPSFAVADLLIARGVPFAFLSGHQVEDLPPRYAASRLLNKPFAEAALQTEIMALLGIPG